MLKAYVCVASNQGLSIFQPERVDTLSLVCQCVRQGVRRLGFWAVMGDSDARSINALFLDGHRKEAMMLLECCATDIGPIMPSDLKRLPIY